MGVFRWRHFAGEIILWAVRWYQGHTGGSWQVDETCIRVDGEWKWLFRAVDKRGRTVDFLLTQARRFLGRR